MGGPGGPRHVRRPALRGQAAWTDTVGAGAPASDAGRCGGWGESIHRPRGHGGFNRRPAGAHCRLRLNGDDDNLRLRRGDERGRVTAAEAVARPWGVVVPVCRRRLGRGSGVRGLMRVRMPGHLHRRPTLFGSSGRRKDGRRTGMEQRQQLPAHTGGEQQQEGRESAEGAARRDHAGETNSVSVGRGWAGGRRLIRAASRPIRTSANAIGVEVSSFTSQR